MATADHVRGLRRELTVLPWSDPSPSAREVCHWASTEPTRSRTETPGGPGLLRRGEVHHWREVGSVPGRHKPCVVRWTTLLSRVRCERYHDTVPVPDPPSDGGGRPRLQDPSKSSSHDPYPPFVDRQVTPTRIEQDLSEGPATRTPRPRLDGYGTHRRLEGNHEGVAHSHAQERDGWEGS